MPAFTFEKLSPPASLAPSQPATESRAPVETPPPSRSLLSRILGAFSAKESTPAKPTHLSGLKS